MSDIKLNEEFENYLLSSYQMSKNDLYRFLDDLSGAFNFTVEKYIQKKHTDLHKEGKKNAEIYQIIQKEILTQRFPGPELSVRQIRRIIYG